MEQDLTVIHNFRMLPEQSLELLGKRLGLRMSRTELLYCARHYQGSSADISADELRFIDALACPEIITLDKIAVGELLTDHDYIADTFADMISKLNELGKAPEKPFTLQDVAALSTRYAASVEQRSITESIGAGHTQTYYAARGKRVQCVVQSECIRFDVLKNLALCLQEQAARADALVLICPEAETAHASFPQAACALLQDDCCGQVHCVCDTESESISHALLRISSGAVVNTARLPLPQMDTSCLHTRFCGLLLALPQENAAAVLANARSAGLAAYAIGVVDHAGYLVVRRDKEVLLRLHMPYLKSICFIRSYTLRVEDMQQIAAAVPLSLCVFESTSDQSSTVRRARHAVRTAQTDFASTALCALQAYLSAVAAGGAPDQIELCASLLQSKHAKMSVSAAALLSGLLGLYRAGAELRAPVQIHAELVKQHSGTAVLASAPLDTDVPQSLQGGKVYLLEMRTDEHGIPVWSEVRALSTYLHRMIKDGSVKSARVICCTTPHRALRAQASGSLTFNPHAEQVLDKHCTLAIIAESDAALEGELIALCTPPSAAQNDNIS